MNNFLTKCLPDLSGNFKESLSPEYLIIREEMNWCPVDGSWTDPVSLGEEVNLPERQERNPRVSRGGNYLFFANWTPDDDEDTFRRSTRRAFRRSAP